MNLTSLIHNPLVQIGLVILVAAVLQFIGHHLIKWLVRRSVRRTRGETGLDERKRANTIITIVRATFTSVVWLTSLALILGLLGINVPALLTGAGLVGVVVGLSAQNTIKDLLAGLFILVERQYRVGDVITLSGGTVGMPGVTGKVEDITLRITKLKDFNGTHITVRNGDPTIIVNQTLSAATVVLSINVSYDSDMTAVKETTDEIGRDMMQAETWKDLIREPIKFVRIDSFTDAAVMVRAMGVVEPASQWDVAGEFRRRLLIAVAKQPKVKLAHS